MDWDKNYNTGDNEMELLRDKWEFEYTAGQLAEAALEKKEYRQSRVEWWEDKRKEVMFEVKESGIEVSESLANSYTSGGGHGPQVMVRADLQTKLRECHERIQKHMSAVREYDGWAQVLGAQLATDKLKLMHSDWLFFFGTN